MLKGLLKLGYNTYITFINRYNNLKKFSNHQWEHIYFQYHQVINGISNKIKRRRVVKLTITFRDFFHLHLLRLFAISVINDISLIALNFYYQCMLIKYFAIYNILINWKSLIYFFNFTFKWHHLAQKSWKKKPFSINNLLNNFNHGIEKWFQRICFVLIMFHYLLRLINNITTTNVLH